MEVVNKPLEDLMVDLETLSTDSNGLILSISAVQFDFETGEIGSIFNMGVNIHQQIVKGAHLDGNTIEWWLQQDTSAFANVRGMYRRPVDEVINEFNCFIVDNKIKNMWGNGCTFDNVMLRNMYKRHSRVFPLEFWADRDVRTVVDIFGIDRREIPFTGTKHNGVDDCRYQIEYITNKTYRKGR